MDVRTIIVQFVHQRLHLLYGGEKVQKTSSEYIKLLVKYNGFGDDQDNDAWSSIKLGEEDRIYTVGVKANSRLPMQDAEPVWRNGRASRVRNSLKCHLVQMEKLQSRQ